MAKLDLEDGNVQLIEVSVKTMRAYLDGNLTLEEILPDDVIDTAQGSVFTDEVKESYVVIKIVK